MVYARIQSEQHSNRSIHWTQQYAALNQVNDLSLQSKRPQKSLKDVQLTSLLPDKIVRERFLRSFNFNLQQHSLQKSLAVSSFSRRPRFTTGFFGVSPPRTGFSINAPSITSIHVFVSREHLSFALKSHYSFTLIGRF